MITAIAHGADGKRIIVLGLSRENVNRLTDGRPIYVTAEHHPGFPEDISVAVVFGETEAAITVQLQPLISEKTKIVGVPRGGKHGSDPS